MWEINWSNLKYQFVYDSSAPLVFNSGMFFFMFTAFLLVYHFVRRTDRLKILYLTAFSYYFYYKTNGFFFLLLLFISASDYIIGRALSRSENPHIRKLLVTISVIINLGILGYFKYTNFFASLIADIGGNTFTPLDIILPVGISFFTFQSISYTVDIYRKKIESVKRYIDYVFYVSFFPQLVAGPIVRARDFIPQIHRPDFVSRAVMGEGVFLCITGLFKKAVISDYISLNFVDRIFDNPSLYSGIENLLGVYGYALQIYCDFSGYSDMAMGIALLLGFRFNINFDSPYKSATITEFWRRWHISLSSWLKDYLYISLGGNRKGRIRTYINLMITMLLGGLWHGAALRFIIWGGIHGISLAVHKLFMSIFPSFRTSGEEMSPFRRFIGIIITFHLVCFGWIFFRAGTMETAIQVLTQIFGQFRLYLLPQFISGYKEVFILMLTGYILHFMPRKFDTAAQKGFISMPIMVQGVCVVAVILLIMLIKSSQVQPFIYFQF